MVAKHQPGSLAAMEGRFHGGTNAELNFIGQPDVAKRRIDNRIYMPSILSVLAFGHISANVQGLEDFPQDERPTNIKLLYYLKKGFQGCFKKRGFTPKSNRKIEPRRPKFTSKYENLPALSHALIY